MQRQGDVVGHLAITHLKSYDSVYRTFPYDVNLMLYRNQSGAQKFLVIIYCISCVLNVKPLPVCRRSDVKCFKNTISPASQCGPPAGVCLF